ncbi:MAG: DUF433 domain-containing protein [Candidatus Margulisiibacteriota bacterium]
MHDNRIEINPRILMGKPVIRGTRIPVYLILDLLSEGRTMEDILIAYPDLKREDLLAALQFGGSLAKYDEEAMIA